MHASRENLSRLPSSVTALVPSVIGLLRTRGWSVPFKLSGELGPHPADLTVLRGSRTAAPVLLARQEHPCCYVRTLRPARRSAPDCADCARCQTKVTGAGASAIGAGRYRSSAAHVCQAPWAATRRHRQTAARSTAAARTCCPAASWPPPARTRPPSRPPGLVAHATYVSSCGQSGSVHQGRTGAGRAIANHSQRVPAAWRGDLVCLTTCR